MELRSPRLWGTVCVLVSAAAFGSMAIFAKLAYAAGLDAASLLFLRFTLAGLCLLPVVLIGRLPWPRGRALVALLVMGGVCYTGNSQTFFMALNYAPAGTVALLLYLYPVLVMLLSAWLFGEQLTARKWLAAALTFSGLVVTLGLELAGQPLGIALGVASALIYSSYILLGGRYATGSHPISSACVVFLAASVTNGLIVLAKGDGLHWPHNSAGWLALLAIALICTVLAIVGFLVGLRWVGATRASMMSTFEPVVTVLLAAVMSMGGGVGVCASLVVAGTLSGHDATVLLPAIYLMGNPVQNVGRCLGTAGVHPRYYPLIIAVCVINALLSIWVMQVIA